MGTDEGSKDGLSKSKYSIDECRRFAEWNFRKGSVSNPAGYARAIHRSGTADAALGEFLEDEGRRLERERELAAIAVQHAQELAEMEKLVGHNARGWAAERAIRVREEAFSGAVFFLAVAILAAALWIAAGPRVVSEWRASRTTGAPRVSGVPGPAPAPAPSPSARSYGR